MIEKIRRAEDPAWRERLEQQQAIARLGRMFGRAEDPLQALQDHADAQLRRSPPHRPISRSRGEAAVDKPSPAARLRALVYGSGTYVHRFGMCRRFDCIDSPANP
jgi:hypothetical protein